MKLFIAISIATMSYYVNADDRMVGNGGDILACSTEQGTKYEVLDSYEARELYFFTPHYENKSSNEFDYLSRTIDRIENIMPLRAALYRSFLESFDDESDFREMKLGEIEDTGFISIPSNCKLYQAANQKHLEQLRRPRYIFNNSLYSKLNSDREKATLILHEFVYREALSYRHLNSLGVRKLVGFLMSEELASATDKEIIVLLEESEFPTVSMNGVEILTSYGLFFESGAIKQATVKRSSNFKIHEQTVRLIGQVFFYPSGQIKSIYISSSTPFKYTYRGVLYIFSGKTVFSNDGTLYSSTDQNGNKVIIGSTLSHHLQNSLDRPSAK